MTGLKVHDLSTEDVQKGLGDGSILLIDVRETDEFRAGHIPGSVSMPLSTFDPSKLPIGQGRRIVFSCRTGGRTLKALQMTQEAGLELSEHYKPSFLGWSSAGGEIVTGD